MHTFPRRVKQSEDIKRRCHRCHATGRSACPICNGSGQVAKGTDINGNPIFGQCSGCFGLKHTRCPVCGGDGFI